MAAVNTAGWSHLAAWRVLLSSPYLHPAREYRTGWSHFLSVKLIRVAGRVVYSREDLQEAETENERWKLLGDNSPWAFGVSACLVSRGAACLSCPFQECCIANSLGGECPPEHRAGGLIVPHKNSPSLSLWFLVCNATHCVRRCRLTLSVLPCGIWGLGN